MRKMLCTLLAAMLCCLSATAQDWRTVRSNDTTYFLGGTLSSLGATYSPGVGGSSRLLRVCLVDSAKAISATDTALYFYKTIRDTSRNGVWQPCAINTAAPSWLGPACIRSTGGTELYFNKNMDTITIRTHAALNDSWVLAKDDTLGAVLMATVAQVATMQIDGTTDSVKKITIQAYQGSTAISHPHNQHTLILSKAHGWVAPLDFYAFPYTDFSGYGNASFHLFGALADTAQHTRLPRSFNNTDLLNEDYSFIIQPGNERYSELTHVHSANTAGANYTTVTKRYDSVFVVSQSSNPPTYSNYWEFFTATSSSMGQTVADSSGQLAPYTSPGTYTGNHLLVKDHILPNVKYKEIAAGELYDSACMRQYFVDTFCNGRLIVHDLQIADQPIAGVAGCLRLEVGLSPVYAHFISNSFLEGFGLMAYRKEDIYGESSGDVNVFSYPYLRLGSCVMGVKQKALSVAGAPRRLSFAQVYPNPATSQVRLSLSRHVAGTLSLIDQMGRVVLSAPVDGNAVALHLPAVPTGMYYLQLLSADGKVVEKLMVVQE